MTALLGHLLSSDFPPEYQSWRGIPFLQLMEAPIIKKVPEVK